MPFQMVRQDSKASKQSYGSQVSEEQDMVQPLQPIAQRTQSMHSMFRDFALQDGVNETVPKQFAFNSFNQAKKSMERLYTDYE